MKKILKIARVVAGIVFVAAIVAYIRFPARKTNAQASNTPTVSITFNGGAPGVWENTGANPSGGFTMKDAQITLSSGGPFTEDIQAKVCVTSQHEPGIFCATTPWASQSGGSIEWSPGVWPGYNDGLMVPPASPGVVSVSLSTSTLPAGETLNNVVLGFALWEANGGPAGGMPTTDMLNPGAHPACQDTFTPQGGGTSPSVYGYTHWLCSSSWQVSPATGSSDFPDVVQIGVSASLQKVMNAQEVSNNIPTTFTPSETVATGTGGAPLSITMQSVNSLPWSSTFTAKDMGTLSGTCNYDYGNSGVKDAPASGSRSGAQCAVPAILASQNYFLVHTPSSFSMSPEKIPITYNVTKTTTYTPAHTENATANCSQDGPDRSDQKCPLLNGSSCSSSDSGGTWTCSGSQQVPDSWVVSYSGGGYAPVVTSGQSVTFPITSITAPSATGTYNETWQMQRGQGTTITNYSTLLPVHGGYNGTKPGGYLFVGSNTCPTGSVMVGYQGSAGQYVDEIQGICQPTGGGATTLLSLHGGYDGANVGGTAFGPNTCPAGSVMVGYQGSAGQYVDEIQGICQPTGGGATTLLPLHGGYDGTDVGGIAFGPNTCPAGSVMVGYQGSAGQYVDEIQGVCQGSTETPPSFGVPFTLPITVGGSAPTGNINVVSEDSITATPVTSTWEIFGAVDVCSYTHEPCSGTSQSYPNVPLGNYITQPLSTSGNFAFGGIESRSVAVEKQSTGLFALARNLFAGIANAEDTCSYVGAPGSSCPAGDLGTDSQTLVNPGDTANFILLWDPEASLSVTPREVSLTSSTPSQQVTVSNSSDAPGSELGWTATSDSSWLSVTPSTDSHGLGSGSSEPVTFAYTGNLATGTYQANVTFTGWSLNVSPTNHLDKQVSVTLTVGGGGCTGSCCNSSTSSTNCPPGVMPSISIIPASSSITLGQSQKLTITSKNATKCTETGDWSGSTCSGPVKVTPNATGTFTYNATTTNVNGSAQASATITVTVSCTDSGCPPPPPPPPGLPSCVQLTATPSSITPGQASQLSYRCTNVSSCSMSGGQFGGYAIVPVNGTTASGAVRVNPIANTIYSLNCVGTGTNSGYHAGSEVQVTVNSPGRVETNP
jgi:hypothetical protein